MGRKGWDMNIKELERSLNDAKKKGINVNSFVLINPNNPTGQVLSRKSVIDIVQFCVKQNLSALELVSFHSTSKGLFGECGRRGGYMELSGFDDYVKDNIYKLASSSLCSNIPGQVMTSIMCRGPPEDGPSYASHQAEMDAIYQSLKRRSKTV